MNALTKIAYSNLIDTVAPINPSWGWELFDQMRGWTGKLRRVCSWCGKDMGFTKCPESQNGDETNGMCESCLIKSLRGIK